jgi:hypothetical protein
MNSLTGGKQQATRTTVDPSVGAGLRRASAFPAADVSARALPATCRRVRITGTPPAATLTDDSTAETPERGFVVEGMGGRPPFVFLNRADTTRIEIWNLSPAPGRGPRELEATLIPPADQAAVAGAFVVDAACLPNHRVLLAVHRYDPRPKPVLYLYDATGRAVTKLADADPDGMDLYRFFRWLPAGPDAALVLYFSGRTRQSAEIYHNFYNHVLLFTPAHPQGLEILKLGIDDGNVREWALADRTLYLKTLDNRDPRKLHEATWTLDLSKLLGK